MEMWNEHPTNQHSPFQKEVLILSNVLLQENEATRPNHAKTLSAIVVMALFKQTEIALKPDDLKTMEEKNATPTQLQKTNQKE